MQTTVAGTHARDRKSGKHDHEICVRYWSEEKKHGSSAFATAGDGVQGRGGPDDVPRRVSRRQND